MYRGKLKQKLWQWRGIWLTVPCVVILIVVGILTGVFQLLEWATLDQFFRLRPSEAPDPRIVLVTIDEEDINAIGQWNFSDQIIADVITNLKQHEPRVMGLALYRNFPIQPGTKELLNIYQDTPNLIGIEKAIGKTIAPTFGLPYPDQVGFSDMILDGDGKIRRGLISIRQPDGQINLSISAQLALMYLEKDNIFPQGIPNRPNQLQLGKSIFYPLRKNDGSYVRVDNGGYQVVLNYRGTIENFQRVSVRDVLANKFPKELIKDRIVIIGSVAESVNEFFNTPYSYTFLSSPNRSAALAIHANLTSQIISAALDGRYLLKVWSDPVEWLWIFVWASIGATGRWVILETHLFNNRSSRWTMIGIFIIPGTMIIFIISYLAFLGGWWLPVITPIIAFALSTVLITSYHHRYLQTLASIDQLTQVANRRFFDEYLEKQWWRKPNGQQMISLILCDIDYFKNYNDANGHQAGDECLQQVAQAITTAVRQTDLVARYGGEEFAIILVDTPMENVMQVAHRIHQSVKSLNISHGNSSPELHVTLSCGVSSLLVNANHSPSHLIKKADQALYEAKAKGRDRIEIFK
jgi:adenylate cyclase